MKIKEYAWIVVGILAILLIFLSLDSGSGFENVYTESVKRMINEDDVFVLQVHTPYDGEINGTDLVIEDWENIENHLDLLPDKKDKILVYCRSGRMSGIVSEKLSDLGYESIYNFEGGMNNWVSSGNELVYRDKI